MACATYMFRKDARIWWEVITQTRNVSTITWEEFQTLFNKKYYNEDVRATKADEFTKLTQGSLSVIDYAVKFDRLAKFAKALVPDNETRSERFLNGLHARLAYDVNMTIVTGPTTHAQIVEKALIAENSQSKVWRESIANRESKKVGRGGGPRDQKRKTLDFFSDRRPQGNTEGRQGSSDNWKSYPQCVRCKKHHSAFLWCWVSKSPY